MLRLLGLLMLAATCSATRMRYPLNGTACILMDITVHNRLSWTGQDNKTVYVPDWNFTDSHTIDGSCDGKHTHSLTNLWNVDNATYTFTFVNNSGTVSLTMDLNFVPDIVFKNNVTENVTLELKPMKLGSADEAYLCKTENKMTAKKTVGNNSYTMIVQIKSIKAQAFNLNGSEYGDVEECDDDKTTQKPTTEPITTPTSPKPEPKPSSDHPKQNVSLNDDGVTCVTLVGQFLFTLPYQKNDGSNTTVPVGLQDIRHINGSCKADNNTNMIQVTFFDGWMLGLTFMKEGKMLGVDDTKYWWSELEIHYKLDNATFPNHNANVTEMIQKKTFDKGQFQATVSGSYLCKTDSTLDLGNGFKMETWDLQYKAFQTDNSTTFKDDNVQECEADAKTSSIVPIAVGAALAGLVVIVLIAYLIGRRRNRKGYESV